MGLLAWLGLKRGDQYPNLDALMRDLDSRYPGFSLSGHKGYPTRAHVAALNTLGPSPLHRRSFGPVRRSDYLEEADLY